MKRLSALALCVVMCISVFPAAAFAHNCDTAVTFADEEEPLAVEEPLPEEEYAPDTPGSTVDDITDTPAAPSEETPQQPDGEAPAEELIAAEDQNSVTLNSGSCGLKAKWSLSSTGVLTITGSGDINNYSSQNHVVGANIYHRTTAPWGSDFLKIKSVVISSGITRIGEYCFKGCQNITKVSLPGTLTEIGNYAFEECCNLPALTMPDSVTSIGIGCFTNCAALSKVTLSDKLTEISSSAFFLCNSLTSVSIPDSVTAIGDLAFGCSGLKSVTVPANVRSIGNEAFKVCPALAKVTIRNGTRSIGREAFYSCEALTQIEIPKSVTTIKESAFLKCPNLAVAKLGNGLTAIPESMFEGCKNLSSVTVGSSVTSIGLYAFKGCISLSSITLPSGLTTIYDKAFYECTRLSSAVLPDTLTSIGAYAFYHCDRLSDIRIPDSVNYIGESAFAYCGQLKNIVIPQGLTKLKSAVLQGCTSLTSVVIPSSVKEIELYAFYGSSNLTQVFFTGTAAQWSTVIKGTNNDPLNYAQIICGYSAPVITTQPASVTAEEGESVKFKVSATGTGLSYSWQRRSPGGSWTNASVKKATLSTTATAQANGRQYRCIITDVAGAKLISKTVTLNVVFTLAAPKGLSADYNTTSGKPVISWNAVENATSYNIYRATASGGSYTKIGSSSSCSYTDKSIGAGKACYYKVKAVNGSNISKFSAYLKAKCHLAKPVDVKAALSSGKPKISWSAVEKAASYSIFRATSSGGTYTKIGTSTSTSYTDKSAVAGKTYYYKITALASASGYTSAKSAAVSIKAK